MKSHYFNSKLDFAGLFFLILKFNKTIIHNIFITKNLCKNKII